MKALFMGSAPIAALGLLLGGLARPELALEAPPPMQPAPVAYASFAAEPAPYGGPMPDYVRGVGWTSRRADPLPPPAAEPEPIAETYVFARYEDVEPTPVDDWAPEPTYPSLDGDVLGGTERDPPPTVEVVSPEA